MTNSQTQQSANKPKLSVECVTESLSLPDLNDLCDATDLAIKAGGGFGWVELPARDILERYWQGVIAMPLRLLFVPRLDGVICGAAQLILPPDNNEAQSFAAKLTGNFIAPWARGFGLANELLKLIEQTSLERGYSVINLSVRETMNVAISLYERNDYELIGKHPYYARVDDEFVAGRLYYKKLV